MLQVILVSLIANGFYWAFRQKALTFKEVLFYLMVCVVTYITISLLVFGASLEKLAWQVPCVAVGDLMAYIIFAVILPSYKTSETN